MLNDIPFFLFFIIKGNSHATDFDFEKYRSIISLILLPFRKKFSTVESAAENDGPPLSNQYFPTLGFSRRSTSKVNRKGYPISGYKSNNPSIPTTRK